MMKIVSAVTVLAVSFPALGAFESTLLPENFDIAGSLEKATALAKQKKKSVIVYYTRTNCPPCTTLQSRLRNEEETATPFRENYVFTAVWGSSMGSSERDTYRNRFNVLGAPTWLVFNSNGEYVCTAGGGIYPNEAGKKVHDAIQMHLKKVSTGEPVATNCRD